MGVRFSFFESLALLDSEGDQLHPATAYILNGLKAFGDSMLELCFPRQCAGCRSAWLFSTEGFWCRTCLELIPWIESPLCPACGRPFPSSASVEDSLCGDCLLATFAFDSARSASVHTGVVRDRIHQLKFGGQLRWAPPLAELLARTFENHGRMNHPDLIIPVPLHLKRLGMRGFNQATVMAGALGRRFGIPVSVDFLARTQWTEPQTRLNRRERLENVKDAFTVMEKGGAEDRKILLLDDVFTTGTTLSECARVLKAAGASEVHALTVTRALPDWKGLAGFEVHDA